MSTGVLEESLATMETVIDGSTNAWDSAIWASSFVSLRNATYQPKKMLVEEKADLLLVDEQDILGWTSWRHAMWRSWI